MNTASNKLLFEKQKEMLVVSMALFYIEQNALMTRAQLNDAKRSLQALFIRTSGEETMLRKLVQILRMHKELHEAFSAISKISSSISTSVDVISRKIEYLKTYVSKLQLTPQENADFFAPFLSFTHQFQQTITDFNRNIERYLEVREEEARRLHEFHIAQDASKRLRDRLSGQLGTKASGEVEESIKLEVLGSFDYEHAKAQLAQAQSAASGEAQQINATLMTMKAMCQKAMNPDMREKRETTGARTEIDDIFMRFTRALKYYPRLVQIRDFIIEYFKLYQRAYGMFMLDFDNFNKAVETMKFNTEGYFESKQEDEDLRGKRVKLKKYEGLIPYLEAAGSAMHEYSDYRFTRFSRKLSEIVSQEGVYWSHISEDLLVAKVAAEADLTTRLNA
ncbi:MAG: hypothetical protein OES09_01895 [Gammaproteobacteria bacterium]|nr:hypothetical protein [Gammaproteobacteria bacterium]